MAKNKAMFKKSKRANNFDKSTTFALEDSMFEELSGAHKLAVMLAEASGIDVKMADYKGTIYVSRETISTIAEELGLI